VQANAPKGKPGVEENTRLLIVEDDPITRNLLEHVLGNEGYEVTAVRDGTAALDELQQHGLPHLVLLDLGLPGMHGFVLSERIKRMGDVPIIILTGDSSEEAIIRGIEYYADDYITKPFNVREVSARIQRVLSRMGNLGYAHSPDLVIDAHLSIDFVHNRLKLDERVLQLTPIETSLLSVLVRNKGQIVSSATLIARAWPNEDVYEENLRVQMSRLRQKLNRQYIQTERGTGYMFALPDEH
jgi:DNA-binding response OmpR family regulator